VSMKQIVIALVAILLLAAGALAGAAYWAGLQTEKVFWQSAPTAAVPANLQITPTRFDRAWFSSTAVTRIDLEPPAQAARTLPEPLRFSLRHDIYHGVLPLAGWGQAGVALKPAQARIRTTLLPDAEWSAAIKKLYGDREPLEIISTIALDGSSTHHVQVAPLTVANIAELRALNFSGVQGQFQRSAQAATLQGELQMAALRLAGDEDRVLALRGLKLMTNQYPGVQGLDLGKWALQLDAMQASGESIEPVALRDGRIEASLTAAQAGMAASALAVSFAELTTSAGTFQTGSLELQAKRLDGAILSQLQRWQQQAAHDPASVDIVTLLGLVQNLLRQQPRLNFTLRIAAPQGAVQADIVGDLQAPRQLALFNPQALLVQMLHQVRAEVAAPAALVERLLAEVVKKQLRTAGQQLDPAELDKVARTLTRQRLAQLRDAGIIRLASGMYRTTARFQDGRLAFNGIVMPLQRSGQ